MEMALKLTGVDQNPCKNYLELSGAFRKSWRVGSSLGQNSRLDI
jgi:hypothetical protein